MKLPLLLTSLFVISMAILSELSIKEAKPLPKTACSSPYCIGNFEFQNVSQQTHEATLIGFTNPTTLAMISSIEYSEFFDLMLLSGVKNISMNRRQLFVQLLSISGLPHILKLKVSYFVADHRRDIEIFPNLLITNSGQ